jgi:transposase
MNYDRKAYPSDDVTDEKRSLVVSYLTLMCEYAPQRDYPLRDLFNDLRHLVRYGIAWRAMLDNFLPWSAVYQQTQRWRAAGCFEALTHDLRAVSQTADGVLSELSPSAGDCGTEAANRERRYAACKIAIAVMVR